MGLISKLMGGEELKSTRSLKAASPTAGIGYDDGLVAKLKGDHQELVRLYTAIKGAAAANRFADLHDLLANFKHAFQMHIALENVKFYVYVQQRMAQDPEASTFISEVRREMNDIARAVLKFVDAYTANPPTPATVTDFSAELDQIGAVLVQRVEKEESRLYSLYQP